MKWEQVGKLELEQLYYEENLPDSLIAERFGISKTEVRKKRKLYNISMEKTMMCIGHFIMKGHHQQTLNVPKKEGRMVIVEDTGQIMRN